MEQTDKELLLKELCARWPYGVKVQIKNEIVTLDSICDDDGYYFNFIGDDREGVSIEEVKPYLFPLSSMTEEQKKELWEMGWSFSLWEISNERFDLISHFDCQLLIDWFKKNHLDNSGLIPKGLAKDCTNLNIY